MILIAKFVLPITCAPTQNAIQRMHWAVYSRLKHECFVRMLAQCQRRSKPLAGVVRIVCTRFANRDHDDGADGTKIAIDCLKSNALRMIVDDDKTHVEIVRQWRYARQGRFEMEVWADGQDETLTRGHESRKTEREARPLARSDDHGPGGPAAVRRSRVRRRAERLPR